MAEQEQHPRRTERRHQGHRPHRHIAVLEANVFFRAMRRTAGWRPISWLFARTLPRVDRFVSRLTGRHLTFAGLATGLQVLLLTTTGARTGTQRTQPLAYLGQGRDFVVIASNFGQQRNPSWYYNLCASRKPR
jgi:hypothetical protein